MLLTGVITPRSAHVGPDLEVDRETIISGPPAHPMVLSAHEQETQSYD